ncbi:DUF4192 family protein [Arthrobacter sp. NPDC055585]
MSEPQKAGHPAAGRPASLRPTSAGSATGGAAGRGSADRKDSGSRGSASVTGPSGTASDTAAPDAADVLRVGTPQDILAFVPHCLGFQPRESLVLLGLRGSRLGATLRLDLPGPACSAEMPDDEQLELISGYTARIAALLSGDKRADGVLAVMYTDLPWREGTRAPYSALMEVLADDLEDSGLRLRDAWLAGNGTWRDYFCADGGCCPWPGKPMGEITESRLNAELVYRGSAYAASPAEALSSAGRLRDDALDARVDEVRRTLEGKWNRPETFDEVLAAWERRISATGLSRPPDAGDGGPPDISRLPRTAGEGLLEDGPADTGARMHEDALLLASLEFKPVRDTILVLAATGMAAAAEGARQWLQPGAQTAPARPGSADRGDSAPAWKTASPGPVVPPEAGVSPSAEAGRQFRAILIGRSSTAPDWGRMDRTYEAFTALVQRAAGEPAAALLTLLGWIEWARGRSSRAEICLSGALREVPGYRLAALLRELLRRGELPQWAQSPATAWPGEGPV